MGQIKQIWFINDAKGLFSIVKLVKIIKVTKIAGRLEYTGDLLENQASMIAIHHATGKTLRSTYTCVSYDVYLHSAEI